VLNSTDLRLLTHLRYTDEALEKLDPSLSVKLVLQSSCYSLMKYCWVENQLNMVNGLNL